VIFWFRAPRFGASLRAGPGQPFGAGLGLVRAVEVLAAGRDAVTGGQGGETPRGVIGAIQRETGSFEYPRTLAVWIISARS
jgi:hypothetical protein